MCPLEKGVFVQFSHFFLLIVLVFFHSVVSLADSVYLLTFAYFPPDHLEDFWVLVLIVSMVTYYLLNFQ